MWENLVPAQLTQLSLSDRLVAPSLGKFKISLVEVMLQWNIMKPCHIRCLV
jgi:hypothetical protein